jgi:hypothetical protein
LVFAFRALRYSGLNAIHFLPETMKCRYEFLL